MKKIDLIPDFVFSCLEQNATEEQITKLNDWLVQSDNAKLYQQLQKIKQLSSDLFLYRSFDHSAGRKKVQKAISTAKYYHIIHQLQRVAAILFIPLIVASIFFFVQNRVLINNIKRSTVTQQIDTQPGTKTHFVLPDSTEVWLNAASIIKFPSIFIGETRLVELDGEAYFKVHKNKKKPFVVKHGNLKVTALGTKFNLCAYPEDNNLKATLEEGKIKVNENLQNKYLIVNPGEQANFSIKEKHLKKTKVNVEDVIAWKEGRLVFNKTPFSEVVTRLNRWFNAEIILTDPSIANYRYTATFTNENISQVMELLELTAPIKYIIKARTINENNTFNKTKIQIQKR